MTPIQIESQNPVLKVTFSHRTGKNGDICLHTGQFRGKKLVKSFVKHLNTSTPTVDIPQNRFF